jgi:hypothetical protein
MGKGRTVMDRRMAGMRRILSKRMPGPVDAVQHAGSKIAEPDPVFGEG